MHELTFTWKGCSPVVQERAGRLLAFELGRQRNGQTVTVATMFARNDRDPRPRAEHLIRIDAKDAVAYLAEEIDGFLIDGVPCPTSWETARAALVHAGRAV